MKDRARRIAIAVVSAGLSALGGPALAQRAGENVITAAEDAFGASVGRETIGLYSAYSVRGFSAEAAGNVRIDGLYFDPVWSPSSQLVQSSAIRVGLSAQGFLFPAPTGVVDYSLKTPGREAAGSIYGSANTYGGYVLELDGMTPLTDELSLGGGVGFYRNEFYNGTAADERVEGLTLVWRPSADIEIRPFWSRADTYDDEFGPTYVPSGAVLPPKRARREFDGPLRPKLRSASYLYGGTASLRPADGWLVRAGLFRTGFNDKLTGTNLLLDVQPDGRANHLLIVDPPGRLASTSGELRVTRSLAEGPRLHVLHASLRGRDRRDRYGGSATLDLGETVFGRTVASPDGPYPFGPQAFDEVRQWTGGLAYEGRWKGVGEVSFGLQKTDYRKTVAQPGQPLAVSEASPWLYSLAAAAYLRPGLVLYAGYTRGLEESGVAPGFAANRGEALPAIRTRQRDAGLRWSLNPKLTLVAGVFEVKKPYFNLDEANVFTHLGEVEHRGIEASLTGRLTPDLDIVAGGVFMHPRVTGDAVALGRVGRRPVGQPARNLQLNLDWRPPAIEGLSFDLAVNHLSKRAATRDNLVDLPPRTLVDVGARYRFEAGGKDASLRLRVSNLFDTYYFDLRGAGAYDLSPGRVASLALAVDF